MMTREMLIELYTEGQRDFSGIEFPDNLNLSSLILDDCDYTKSVLGGAVFRASSLRNVKFCRCYLKHADFSKADLSGTVFERSSIEEALYVGAKVSAESLVGAYAYGSTLDLAFAQSILEEKR